MRISAGQDYNCKTWGIARVLSANQKSVILKVIQSGENAKRGEKIILHRSSFVNETYTRHTSEK